MFGGDDAGVVLGGAAMQRRGNWLGRGALVTAARRSSATATSTTPVFLQPTKHKRMSVRFP